MKGVNIHNNDIYSEIHFFSQFYSVMVKWIMYGIALCHSNMQIYLIFAPLYVRLSKAHRKNKLATVTTVQPTFQIAHKQSARTHTNICPA